MRFVRFHVVAPAVVVALVACHAGDGSSPQASEDERGNVGVPNPAAEYCIESGFTVADSQCHFPDGTSCEEWSFYRAQCGQAHSYCNQHGGTVSTDERDAGTFTTINAVCALNGKTCDEAKFSETGTCE